MNNWIDFIQQKPLFEIQVLCYFDGVLNQLFFNQEVSVKGFIVLILTRINTNKKGHSYGWKISEGFDQEDLIWGTPNFWMYLPDKPNLGSTEN